MKIAVLAIVYTIVVYTEAMIVLSFYMKKGYLTLFEVLTTIVAALTVWLFPLYFLVLYMVEKFDVDIWRKK